MSLPRQVALAVVAKPGIAQRELPEALKAVPSRVATAVNWLMHHGKLSDNDPEDPRERLLYPTETTLLDGRKVRVKHARKPRRPPPAAKPKLDARPRLISPPPLRTRPPSDKPETVEEFLARGGQIQRLPFGHCNNDLRFDHSGHTHFTLRRPVMRAAPAAGAP